LSGLVPGGMENTILWARLGRISLEDEPFRLYVLVFDGGDRNRIGRSKYVFQKDFR